MKQDLGHLTLPRQEYIHSIVEIIKQVTDPEMIILFGSFAKGKFVQHRYTGGDGILYEYTSDLDFLVILKDESENVNEFEWEINEKTSYSKSPVNLQIHGIDYVNQALEIGQYFFSDIIKEGVLLHDTGKYVLSTARVLSSLEIKTIAQDNFILWFKNGSTLLKSVNYNLGEEHLKLAAFELHQAAESFYYATLLVFTGYKPKTHNLANLRNLCREYSDELIKLFPIESDNEEKRVFLILKRAYIEARYKIDYEVDKKDILTLFAKVKVMESIVETTCVDKIASF